MTQWLNDMLSGVLVLFPFILWYIWKRSRNRLFDELERLEEEEAQKAQREERYKLEDELERLQYQRDLILDICEETPNIRENHKQSDTRAMLRNQKALLAIDKKIEKLEDKIRGLE